MNRFEHKIVSFIAAVSPWTAPAIPTYFTVHNAVAYLLFGDAYDSYFVWILAIALEFVGLAAVHTVLEFVTWNKNKGHEEKAPTWVAVIAAIFYVVVVLTVNATLELNPGDIHVAVFARGALSLLSLPAALIVGVRAQHARRQEGEKEEQIFEMGEVSKDNELKREIKRIKAQQKYGTSETGFETPATSRSNSRSTFENPSITPATSEMGFRTPPTSGSISKTGRPSIHQHTVYSYMDRVLSEQGRTATYAEVARELNLPQSTASRLRNSWIERNQ